MSKRKTTSTKAWTEREARRVLAQQRKSGMSVAAFAKERGLVPERLYWWQRKLKATEKSQLRKKRTAATGSTMEFVEVTPAVGDHGVGAGGNGERFEVVLSSGRRVWVPSGFAARDMQRLVAVLEGVTC